MNIFGKRRLYSLLVFIGGASFIFLCFQIFSLEILSSEGSRKAEKGKLQSRRQREFHPKDVRLNPTNEGCLTNDCGNNENSFDKIKELSMRTKSKKFDVKLAENGTRKEGSFNVEYLKHKSLVGKREEEPIQIPDVKQTTLKKPIVYKQNDVIKREWREVADEAVPRGVLKSSAYLYLPGDDGLFQCLYSKEKFPMSHLNDDYCDCKDSSDEPGTDACPNSRFYCTFQLSEADPKWLPGSHVNDGICDCCDGSDEWRGNTPPQQQQLLDQKEHYGIHQAPCQDRCDELRDRKRHLEDIREKGRKIKQSYINEAKGIANRDQIYGVDGEFYHLSENCYSLHVTKYEYKLCPFKSVHQSWGSEQVLLGEQTMWLTRGSGAHGNVYKMVMERGLSKQCPEAKERKTYIDYQCGLGDAILSIMEDEACVYSIIFSTPAAC